MRVVGYTKVIPPGKYSNNKLPKDNHKLDIIKNFIQGVREAGDNGLVYDGYEMLDSDVAVMQGFLHDRSDHVPHIQLRRNIASNTRNKWFITADSNLFLYKAKQNAPFHYLRYSINGVFSDTGIYCNDKFTDMNWRNIQRDLGVSLKPWSINERDTVLLCLQRNGGWSMKGKDVVSWANEKIRQIREHTNRPIIVRPHPGDKKAPEYVKGIVGDNVRISFGEHIEHDLAHAFVTVGFNSSPLVASVIEGVPIIVEDPKSSQVEEVCHTDLSQMVKLQPFDREEWIRKIAQCHWSFADLRSGEAWQWMKQYLK
tara:strand:- start:1078 stop:2013 length:936 start_codon:yes stop_codon:yes gene_type:complete